MLQSPGSSLVALAQGDFSHEGPWRKLKEDGRIVHEHVRNRSSFFFFFVFFLSLPIFLHFFSAPGLWLVYYTLLCACIPPRCSQP